MKRLEGLKWEPLWVSHLGCLKGCLNYLGQEMTSAWLYGATGHGFMINISDDLCSSGPTAWKTNVLLTMGSSVGFRTIMVFGYRGNGDLAAAQQRAWETARRAIDDGIPCYGWELDVPEFYVINGYDETGYHYQGCTVPDGAGPKPWQELGDTGIGCVELVVVHPQPARDEGFVVRNALEFALAVGAGGSDWVLPGYTMGPAAYDVWTGALKGGSADGTGAAYNAAVWESCRRHAAAFLREAGERVGGSARELLEAAANEYRTVSCELAGVSELYPFVDVDERQREASARDPERAAAAAARLERARGAEMRGLELLAECTEALA